MLCSVYTVFPRPETPGSGTSQKWMPTFPRHCSYAENPANGRMKSLDWLLPIYIELIPFLLSPFPHWLCLKPSLSGRFLTTNPLPLGQFKIGITGTQSSYWPHARPPRALYAMPFTFHLQQANDTHVAGCRRSANRQNGSQVPLLWPTFSMEQHWRALRGTDTE